jgi:hypothetical protein
VPPFRSLIPTILIGCVELMPPTLCFPACLFHRVDIPILDGKIA